MCGIAGYVQRREDRTTIGRMTARLAHRGPDGEGFFNATTSEWAVAFGHRRLSIIDIEGGKQPLANEDGRIWVTYNGEIYNFRALRADLERKGHRFATRSDTEVVVHHYEEYGQRRLADFRGMFAFGLWDQTAQHLLLARDRIGIKPLYYASLPDGGIAFASELTALLAHPQVTRELDPQGLALFFFADYVQPPHTLLRGVCKLEPGYYLVWTPMGLQPPRPFWELRTNGSSKRGNNGTNLSGRLRQEIDAAVDSQLLADVPVGVFLSGGIDSSIVAALAQRHTAAPIQTFSIAFEDQQFDESPHARRVSSWIGSRHVEQTFGESALLENLDSALDCLDEPIADPSILPTWLLSRLAAEHVKVVLGGDGGDELWAGYPTYKAHRYAALFAMLPQFVREELLAPLVAALPVQHGYQSFEWKVKRFVHRWDEDPVLRHRRWMSNTDLADLPTALTQCDEMPFNRLPAGRCNGDFINRILALDLSSYLPGSVLTKLDRASMAHGLEVRPPLLDNRLVDFAFSLPSRLKLKGITTKALLKAAAAELLPPDIVRRRKKGFAIPLARWINGPLRPRMERVINCTALWKTGLLRKEAFTKWLHEHQQMTADRSKSLWALLVLDSWFARIEKAN